MHVEQIVEPCPGFEALDDRPVGAVAEPEPGRDRAEGLDMPDAPEPFQLETVRRDAGSV